MTTMQNVRDQSSGLRSRAGTVGVVVLVLAAVMLVEWLGGTARNDQAGAFAACTQFVERTLRSPGSAQHPAFLDAAVSNEDPVYVVTSHVDSQNGFGALLRTSYRCEVAREGQGWKLVDLKVNNK